MTPLLWPSRCLSRSLALLNRRPRGSLCFVMGFFIAFYQHFLRTSAHQGPRPLRPGVAFPTTSRLYWNSNSLAGTQLVMAPSTWFDFPYHISSISVRFLTQLSLARRTQLNYIIVRRPLDLWNQMFNRHQAEITVMQFRGHSLPVHLSVVYHRNFFCSSHFISQFPTTRFPLITAIRMCHFLPVHHLEWHFWPGQKVKT